VSESYRAATYLPKRAGSEHEFRSERNQDPMDRTEIFERVQRVIAETLAVDISAVQPQTRLVEDLATDSMQLITIVIALDEEFNAEFNTDELTKETVTVQWVADYVGRTLGTRS